MIWCPEGSTELEDKEDLTAPPEAEETAVFCAAAAGACGLGAGFGWGDTAELAPPETTTPWLLGDGVGSAELWDGDAADTLGGGPVSLGMGPKP